ncbi:MAG TPA: YciI family protein [Candidatus Dormibacteraeota bacterium]|nr:YciI family protein [Candidatus Dormibacteraeota bacterium]
MKYALVIVEDEAELSWLSDAERDFHEIVRWFADLRGQRKVIASGRLEPRRTARTVSWKDRDPVVTDGPFIEAKETIAGVVLLDVESDAAAVDIAKSWPSRRGYRIEVRPISQATYDGC